MPSSDAILASATAIANEWRTVAIAWHVAMAVGLAAIIGGCRPSYRVLAYGMCTPFLSVSAAAWAAGNPFNGTVFALLVGLLLGLATRVSRDPVCLAPAIMTIPGVLLMAFGAGYPHFLDTASWLTYAYAAPLGVLPCPTLAAVTGATLVFGLLGSTAWSVTIIVAALAYGVVGVFVLGVELDYVLVVAALALTGATMSSSRPSQQSDAPLDAGIAARPGMPLCP